MFTVSFVITSWRLETICFLNAALVPEYGIFVWQDIELQIPLWFGMTLYNKDAVPSFTSLLSVWFAVWCWDLLFITFGLPEMSWFMLVIHVQRTRFWRRWFGRLEIELQGKGSILVLVRTFFSALCRICLQKSLLVDVCSVFFLLVSGFLLLLVFIKSCLGFFGWLFCLLCSVFVLASWKACKEFYGLCFVLFVLNEISDSSKKKKKSI